MLAIFSRPKILLVLLILLSGSFAKTQDTVYKEISTTQDILNYSNRNYGVDDRLISGSLYQNTNIVRKGHPNFLTKDWGFGPLYIKGVMYKDVRLKYNIEHDKIILLTKFSNGNVMQMSINDNLVDSVYIKDRLIINSELIPFELSGFYEPIYNGKSIKVYKKHKTKFRITKISYRSQISSETIAVGYYDEPTSTMHMHINDEFLEITRKKVLLNLFKENKKEIKKFLKKNFIDYKEADNNQLYKLFKYCDEILFKQNDKN